MRKARNIDGNPARHEPARERYYEALDEKEAGRQAGPTARRFRARLRAQAYSQLTIALCCRHCKKNCKGHFIACPRCTGKKKGK